MNGVRRFLGGGSSSPQDSIPPIEPLVVSGKPSWPPSPTEMHPASPLTSPNATNSTAALFLKKDRQKPLDEDRDPADSSTRPTSNSSSNSRSLRLSSPVTTPPASGQSLPSSPGAGSSSPLRPSLPTRKSMVSRKSVHQIDPSYRRASELLNVKDELLMTLLASEAVVDSREYVILSAEEVEELKKEEQVLSARLIACHKKLTLETKLRDAAVKLSKVNASHRKMSKQTQEQVDTANQKVDAAQKELWRVSERVNEVNRKLLEHRAGVLGFSVRSMEKKIGPPNGDMNGSGYNTPNRALSPTLSTATSGSASTKPRFEGAHFFAGHADALVPQVPRAPPTVADIVALEDKLKAATASLNAANRKQAEMRQELSILRLEKEEVQTMMGMDLQSAEETIASLEKEMSKLDELAEKEKAIDRLERRLEVLEEQSGESSELQNSLVQAREDLAQANSETDRCRDTLRTVVQTHAAAFASGDASLSGLVSSIGAYLDDVAAKLEEQNRVQRKLQEDVQNGFDKRENLSRELEDARREREAARNELREAEDRFKIQLSDLSAQKPSAKVEYTGDAASLVSALQPIWSILPSPEARAAKLGPRSFRTGSPTPQSPHILSKGSPKMGSASLSEMDVKSLKSLYGGGTPSSPNPAGFTIEAFVARIQALIQDDRALIERLIRFAQAHDLLKKNAERAQKLATESNQALETYQKQVKSMEERNASQATKMAALEDEVQRLQETVDRITTEKREVETLAAEQAETCRQLTDANTQLSARTLTLASEAANSSDNTRKQLEGQLTEVKTALKKAEEEVEAMRMSDQSQRMALLDELNTLQTDNGALRAQLRALNAKK